MEKKTILVVEDEAGIADTIIYALSTEGFNPLWVTTGEKALKTFKNEKIDLIVIDIGLPDINGFELLKMFRTESQVPVIFLTARSEELDKVLGLELGADDYITKPFSPRELTARIKANVRRFDSPDNIGGNSSSKEDSRFRIDEHKKQIYFYSKELDLSFYEYKILALLLSNPGWVYTREKIIEVVWDDTSDIFDRTVDAHIKSIRSKMKGINDKDEPLVTHRGFGYSIKEDVLQ